MQGTGNRLQICNLSMLYNILTNLILTMYAFIQNIRNVTSTLKRLDFNVKPRRDNGEILTLKQLTFDRST